MNREPAQQKSDYYETGFSKTITFSSSKERELFEYFYETLSDMLPLFGAQFQHYIPLLLPRQGLSRILYYAMLYEKIITVPGVICEFGVQWGASAALLTNLRGMFEPYNHTRRIIGFDTFSGFPAVHGKDKAGARVGDYGVPQNYEHRLSEILSAHEELAPIAHIRKHELVKGDIRDTFGAWLDDNPHVIISMAILDFDLYEPTKFVLERIGNRLTKGSVLVFDELCCGAWPGETVALQEVIGSKSLRLQRYPHQTYCAFAVVE